MDSSELRVFQAVAKEGSITKAAQTLGYVQSNVTARVQQLEAQLNTPLFYRQRGMVLTPAGEKLLSYSERILHLLEEAKNALYDTEEPTGRLSLGANHKVASIHLPDIIAKYHNAYPNVDLSLITDSEDKLIDKIRHFQLDAAFIKSSLHDENIVEELVLEEELVLISNSKETNIKEVCNKPFLMNSTGCEYRTRVEHWLKSVGITQVRFMEFNYLDAIIKGVIAGLGASLVPYSAIETYERDNLIRTFPIPTEYRSTKTFLIRHKNSMMTSTLTKFIELVKMNSPFRDV